MAIAEVYSDGFSSGSANVGTGGRDFTFSPTAGNTLLIMAYWRGSTSTTCTVTPTGGSATFTSRLAQLGGSTYFHIVTAHNIGSGITKINVAPNVGARGEIFVAELSGVDNSNPIDVTTVGGALASASVMSPPAITPVTLGAWVFSGWGNKSNAATSTPFKATSSGPTAHSGTKAGAGWTAEWDRWNQGPSTHSDMAIASNIVNDTSGAYQPDWTLAGNNSDGSSGAIALRPLADAVDPTKFFAIL